MSGRLGGDVAALRRRSWRRGRLLRQIPKGNGNKMSAPDRETVTRLLNAWTEGEEAAGDRLWPVIYAELRRMAARSLRKERSGHTLQPTALVHEAYLRLIDQRTVHWQCRSQFFALAARMIRRILVDHARKRAYAKRGGGVPDISLDDVEHALGGLAGQEPQDLVALDNALRQLAAVDESKAQIIELRYFGGLQFNEIAPYMGLSTATVNRRWRAARAWLFHYLSPAAD